ncbi:MAG: TRAP transporter substrate-binding protein, partial [bacterium]
MLRSRFFGICAAVAIVTALLALASAPQAGAQQRMIIRFGHVGFPGSLFDLTASEYAKRVNSELGARV